MANIMASEMMRRLTPREKRRALRRLADLEGQCASDVVMRKERRAFRKTHFQRTAWAQIASIPAMFGNRLSGMSWRCLR
jgi:hypothetical protein